MSEKNYKDTLNMPKTDFEMRANLTIKEPLYRQEWLDNKIYQKLLEKNQNNLAFILHDGPPYANGDIHIGHAMNKILKDIIVRYKAMRGYYTPFVPGWDTHGMPIEHKMLELAHLNSNELEPLELRKRAQKYALEQVEIQKEQFKKLQLLTDFEKYYLTLDKQFVAKQLKLFKKMLFDGLIYKGLKPVYWSPSSQSALAEAEVEYKDIISPSIFVAFKIIDNNNSDKINNGDNLVIWTTTPWTLLANSAVAIGENIEYSKVSFNNNNYIIASELVEKVIQELEIKDYKIENTLNYKELLGITYLSPLNHNKSPVVIGHHVSAEGGSGLVHIAPLFGEDDFKIGNKNRLNMIMHVEDNGLLNENGLKYKGLFYEKANEAIITDLAISKNLLANKNIKHSYPHDWRTHKPILFRGTPQWFVSIDKIKTEILNKLIKVKTYPEWANKRLSLMISERNDWTISRQRTWGVPIIIFYDKDKKPVLKSDIFDHVIDLIEKNGSNIWWEKNVDELLPEAYKNKGFTKENDIMDVWFDSGSTSFAVEIDSKIHPPYDLYLEGSDQYRGWFNSSLINSVAFSNISPYKQLVSHGFVLDEKGNKMSKSKGNTIDPKKIIDKYGADILRLWVANSEYSNDVTIGDSIINQNAEIYRKLRNTIKFMLGNLHNFNYDKNIVRTGVHAFIKAQLEEIKSQIYEAYDEYKFTNVIKLLNNYVVELSSFYLNISKDVLYVDEFNSKNRLMTLTNIYEIVEFLILALAPILPTTAEDAYKHFNSINKEKSVHLASFPKVENINKELIDKWSDFFKFRDEVNIKLENAIKNNLIKRTNEAKLIINNQSEFIKSLDLKQLLMVGLIEYGNELKIETFESLKCERCWNHFLPIQIKNNLCTSCFEIIRKMENNNA
ncbi:isoleucine--tRNA ligase [Mycoplasmopsis meleagridis]|uniref:isoleucine--tRNA ligase n=1 Tax=Mycoplasmopsis meleagridis TaxID=29561 RepID=UPI00073D20B5|nr:isoleucine--tRNA ligase [Mycoplasmopsis meleagridis]KUH47219.1 isoleucine--tRNA ligase [Mycoplasmopsis meleagridis]KUH47502.1 isoleucine--tRNA ligase [Mycoplasmopsis meleagridis]